MLSLASLGKRINVYSKLVTDLLCLGFEYRLIFSVNTKCWLCEFGAAGFVNVGPS